MRKTMFLLVSLFFLWGLSVGFTTSVSSVQADSWYETNGTQIIGPDNKPVVFHGVNSSGMEWGAGYPWKAKKPSGKKTCGTPEYGCWGDVSIDDEYVNLADWGFNLVRLPIAWANIEPTAPTSPSAHNYNQEYFLALDDIIAKFGEKHIPVILCMHQWAWSPAIKAKSGAHKGSHGLGMPVWLYSGTPGISQGEAQRAFFIENTEILPGYRVQDAYIDVWKTVVERYKNNPTVIGVDLFNEPPGQFNYNLASFYEKVGLAINGINPKLLLIFEDGVNQSFKLKRKPEIPNAVYSFHMYPSSWLMPGKNQPSGQDEVNTHLTNARKWNVPSLVGEFAYIGPKGQIDKDQTKTMLDSFKENGISWTYWAYQKTEKPLAEKSGKEAPDIDLVKTLQSGF